MLISVVVYVCTLNSSPFAVVGKIKTKSGLYLTIPNDVGNAAENVSMQQ